MGIRSVAGVICLLILTEYHPSPVGRYTFDIVSKRGPDREHLITIENMLV